MECKENELFVYQAVTNGDLEISDDGAIWRIRRRGWSQQEQCVVSRPCKKRRAEHDCGEYFQVRAMIDGVRVYALAHRLVYLHFKGPIPHGLTINHEDGIKKNNHPRNLTPATQSEQILHAFRIGLKSEWGEANPAAKITNADIELIRAEYAAGGMTQKALGEKYGAAHQTISKIVRGERRPQQRGSTQDYTHRRERHDRDDKGRYCS
jgi:hypothetical protein